ncbi:MAG: MurR/RpiR family transcriptional regulator [Clostridium sp.]|jgi:DNA-binding MurR/RpiR family transcriptional regulator
MLQEMYETYKKNFSKSDYLIMEYLMRNEEQLPYIDTQKISRNCSVSAATISRFWKKIQVPNLKALKDMLRLQETATPSSRLASAIKQFQDGTDLTEHVNLHLEENLQKTLLRLDPSLPADAAKAILHARKVYIMAPDASLGLADIFLYRVRRLGLEPIMIPGGSAIYEYMINISSRDIVLLFGFSRLINEIRILLDHCESIGCASVLFTDMLTLPNCSPPLYTFYCCRGDANAYHSMSIPMLILDLLILNLMHAKRDSLSDSQRLEKLRSKYANLIGR